MNPNLQLWIESHLWPWWGDLTWQGTALLSVTLVVVWCLRHHAASRRHGVLALGMIGFTLLVALSFVMPTWSLRKVATERESMKERGRVTVFPASVKLQSPAADSSSLRSDEAQTPVTGKPRAQLAGDVASEIRITLPVMLSAIWLSGMALGGGLLALSMLRLHWLRLRSRTTEHAALVEALDRARKEAGLAVGRVHLHLGDPGIMPMMWGWRQIVILLPHEAEDWPQERLDLVLRHELAHAVRGDAPVSLACWLAMLPLWWHPLAWVALRMLSRLREEACDEQVMRGLDRRRRESYAEMLVQVIAGTSDPFRRAWLPALAMASLHARTLRARLEAIVSENRDRRPFTRWGQTCATGGIALIAVSLSMLSACRQATTPGPGVTAEDGSRIYFLTDKQWDLLTEQHESGKSSVTLPTPDPFASSGLKPVPAKPKSETGGDLLQAALRIRTHLLEAGVTFTGSPEGEVVVLKDERTMRVWTDDAGHGLITRILARESKKPLVCVICHVFAVPIGSDWIKKLTNLPQAPTGSQVGLTGTFSQEEASKLIDGLRADKTCSIFSTPTVTVPSGQRALIENIREFIYPTEFDPPHMLPNATAQTPLIPTTPTAFEMRPVGFRCEVEPTANDSGSQIDLTLAPEWTVFEGFVNYGAPIYGTATDATGKIVPVELTANAIQQPVFRTSKVTTSVTIRDGNTVVLGGFGEPPGADVGRPTGSADVRAAGATPESGEPTGVKTVPGTQGGKDGNLNLSTLPPVSKVDRAVFFLFQAKVLE